MNAWLRVFFLFITYHQSLCTLGFAHECVRLRIIDLYYGDSESRVVRCHQTQKWRHLIFRPRMCTQKTFSKRDTQIFAFLEVWEHIPPSPLRLDKEISLPKLIFSSWVRKEGIFLSNGMAIYVFECIACDSEVTQ